MLGRRLLRFFALAARTPFIRLFFETRRTGHIVKLIPRRRLTRTGGDAASAISGHGPV